MKSQAAKKCNKAKRFQKWKSSHPRRISWSKGLKYDRRIIKRPESVNNCDGDFIHFHIANSFYNTQRNKCPLPPPLHIVEVVCNAEHERKFEKKKLEFAKQEVPVDIEYLFHGTSLRADFNNLINKNFDKERIGTRQDMGYHGFGFYFSRTAEVARRMGGHYLLMCKVLLGKKEYIYKRERSRYGKKVIDFNSVIFKDGEEVVVRDADQILISYALYTGEGDVPGGYLPERHHPTNRQK